MSTETALDPARSERPARLAACLHRARLGDRAALEEIVRELNPLLWHVVRAQGLDAEQAVDVVQTTWLELLKRLHEIREPQALTAWLTSTARREAWHVRDRSRRTPTTGADVLAEVADPDPDPGDVAVRAERDRTLLRHLAQLPQRCRELLRIVAHVDRPDYTAVAEALGMPRGSIGPTRGRCLAKLRELLLADPQWSTR